MQTGVVWREAFCYFLTKGESKLQAWVLDCWFNSKLICCYLWGLARQTGSRDLVFTGESHWQLLALGLRRRRKRKNWFGFHKDNTNKYYSNKKKEEKKDLTEVNKKKEVERKRIEEAKNKRKKQQKGEVSTNLERYLVRLL